MELEPGDSICPDCGEKLMHGGHLRGRLCSGTKCLRCRRLGLRGNPCVHEREQVDVKGEPYIVGYDGVREYATELKVWL